jgi:hypothetical protein
MFLRQEVFIPGSDPYPVVGFCTGGIKPSASTARDLLIASIWKTVFQKVSTI